MADAIIDLVGPEDLPLIVQLYNQMFRPPRDIEMFRRRYRGRYNILQLIARIGPGTVPDQPQTVFVRDCLFVQTKLRDGPANQLVVFWRDMLEP